MEIYNPGRRAKSIERAQRKAQSENVTATGELAAMLYEEMTDKDAAIAALSEMIAEIYEGGSQE